MSDRLLSIRLIEFIVNLYDIITLPLYYLIQRPWAVKQAATRIRARQVEKFVWENIDNKLDKSSRKSVSTLDELFRNSVETYALRPCLGVRNLLAVEYKGVPLSNGSLANGITSGNGPSSSNPKQQRVVSKFVLDDKYTWFTYKEVEEIVVNLSSGLIGLCGNSLKNSDGSRKLLICADTCMPWFMMAHACFRNNVTVVTAYTSLDDEAILHIIQQTEVRILVVSQKFARRLFKILPGSPLVDTIIVLDEPYPGEEDELKNLKSLLESSSVQHLISYQDLLARGKQSRPEIIESVPTGDDIAVLMYTSGSSGKAKGVLLSHKSIVYTALSFSGPGDISHEDRYIGYLPLGHVLELAAECIFLRNGSTIAYSSPFTLTDASPMIKPGQKGDAAIFKPTIMGAVPLVLDRIRAAIQQTVKSRGPFYDQLINGFVVRYKRYWYDRCYDTPIMNYLICLKFRMILGGKLRAICSGGAALSRETQEYLRHVTNHVVLQGYGLTETSAAASFCDIEDRRYNVVGPPYPIVRIKLESWSDYTTEDKPYPRGEVIIGGQPVASGYYKMPELTEESFYVDERTGMRFFRTGDIGMMLPDGVLKIIDRKKDIVKPLSGEYISLSEIETVIRSVPIVENVFVYCSPYSNYIVAVVKVEPKELTRHAEELLSTETEASKQLRSSIAKSNLASNPTSDASMKDALKGVSLDILSSNDALIERITKLIQTECAKKKLKRTQIPSKVKLVTNDWTPESGLVTASFKLRRRELERHYDSDIKQLYAELGQKIDQDAP